MKCINCEKEFQTYNGVCPFCHSKNKTDGRAQHNIRNTPFEESSPLVPSQTNRLTEKVNTNTPIKSRSPNQTLKYVLIVGMGLLVLLSVAAMTQSFLGGLSLSASAPGSYVSPTPTDIPIPSLPPLTSSVQPKITYSGSNAGTLSPYGGNSRSVKPRSVAPDYTAPGYRTTPGIPQTESTSTGSYGGSSVVYTTTIPTTIVTVSPPKTVGPPISQPKAVESPSTPPKSVEPQKHQVGDVLYEMGGGGNPFYSFYVVMGAEYRDQSSPYMGGGWIYTVLRVYEYPAGGKWYALVGAQPTEIVEETMVYDAGYSTYSLGVTTNINPLPREPAIVKLPEPKFHQYDIVQVNGYYDGPGLIHSGGNTGTYSIVRAYDTSNEGDVGVYFTSEIRKKEDGSWGYVLSRTLTTSFWDEKREFEANVNQFVTHLTDDTGLEYVDEFPTIEPISLPKTPTPCGTGCSPVRILKT